MKKKTGIIILARLTSNRLPRKHLLKILDFSIIEFLIERLKKIKLKDEIILATSKGHKDDELIDIAKKTNISFFRGDSKNVLRRVLMCSKKFSLNKICLITADCPIIDPELIKKMLIISKKNDNVDYINNAKLGLPNGMGCQVFSYAALKKSFLSLRLKDETEHVTLNIRRNNKKFKTLYIRPKKENLYPNLSITLDEYDDYLLIKKIIEYFSKKNKLDFNCEDIINLLKKNKSWLLINKNVKRIDNKIKFSYS